MYDYHLQNMIIFLQLVIVLIKIIYKLDNDFKSENDKNSFVSLNIRSKDMQRIKEGRQIIVKWDAVSESSVRISLRLRN